MGEWHGRASVNKDMNIDALMRARVFATLASNYLDLPRALFSQLRRIADAQDQNPPI